MNHNRSKYRRFPHPTGSRDKDSRKWLIVPPLAVLFLFMVLPVLYTFWVAFLEGDKTVLETIGHILSYPLYRKVLFNTLYISLLVTFSTFLVGYPIAFLMAHSTPKREKILLTILISSMWLSILIRSYAWTVLLQRQGPINSFLLFLGIFHEPVSFMFTRFAVVLGMTHVLLPYMVLIIWIAMKQNGRTLEKVASSFGATRTFYFFRVFLPISKGGAAAGMLLVFLLSFGFYITPALLGGGQGETMMIAMLIEEQMNNLGQWKMGSAISIVLLALISIIMALIWRLKTTKWALNELFSGNGIDE